MNRTFFLPGAGASSAFWKSVSSLIDFKIEPVHFSWPDLGNEAHHPDINCLDDLVSLVSSRLEASSDLIAQSMGGLVAVKVAMKARGRVKRLILTAASAGLPMRDLGATGWTDSYIAEYPNSSRWITEVQEDLTDELKHLEVPTLLIWGDQDPISPLAVGRRLKEIMPNAQLHIVAGGDHNLANTHVSEIAPIIAKHIDLGLKRD